jgi:transcription antitermination factor NusA-like protein
MRGPGEAMPGGPNKAKDDIYARLSEFPLKSARSRWTDGPPPPAVDERLLQESQALAQANNTGTRPGDEGPNPLSGLQKEQSELFNQVLDLDDQQQPNVFNQTGALTLDTAEDQLKSWERKESDAPSKLRTGFSNFGTQYFSYTQGCNPNIINTLNDNTKIKRKIYMPKNNKFNYTGLIIGPKGANQKRLEEETGCKILVRGRGSQKEGQPTQPDDNEDLHVLVAGDNELGVVRACEGIERIIFADEDSRNNIRQAQLKIVAQIKNTDPLGAETTEDGDMSLTTPYGPPSHDAFVIAVPKDCVGLVIGRFGETIRRLQVESGATKVQVAADNKAGAEFRNVFVEGTDEACERVKTMLNEIVEQQQRIKAAMAGNNIDQQQGVVNSEQKIIVKVPHSMIGLVIGKNGETLREIYDKTGATVFMPMNEDHPDSTEKTLICSGTYVQTEAAREEIELIVSQKNLTVSYWRVQGDQPLDLHSTNNNMEYSIPNSVQQIPGFEKLHEIQPLINPNYYNETSQITETEYWPDGTVKTSQLQDVADYSGMLLQQSSALLQQSPFGGAGVDMNMAMGGQGYVDPTLYASYMQSLMQSNPQMAMAYQAQGMMPGYGQEGQLEEYSVPPENK